MLFCLTSFHSFKSVFMLFCFYSLLCALMDVSGSAFILVEFVKAAFCFPHIHVCVRVT